MEALPRGRIRGNVKMKFVGAWRCGPGREEEMEEEG